MPKTVVVLNCIVLGLLLLYAAGSVLLKAAQNGLFQQIEISRVPSKSGAVEAVVTRINAPLSRSSFQVHLVEKGEKAEATGECFNARQIEGLRLRWEDDSLLTIQYDIATIDLLRNRWDGQNCKTVEARLVPTHKRSLVVNLFGSIPRGLPRPEFALVCVPDPAPTKQVCFRSE